jgi:hypothetical protein
MFEMMLCKQCLRLFDGAARALRHDLLGILV